MSLNYDIYAKGRDIELKSEGTFNPDYLDSIVKGFEDDIAKSQVELEAYKKKVEAHKAWIAANVRKETRVCISHTTNPTQYLVYLEEHYIYPEGQTNWYKEYKTRKEFTGQTAQKDALAYMAQLIKERKPNKLSGTNYLEKLAKLFWDDISTRNFILSEKKRIDDL